MELESPDSLARWSPSNFRKERELGPITLEVSIATGWKRWWGCYILIFFQLLFLCSSCYITSFSSCLAPIWSGKCIWASGIPNKWTTRRPGHQGHPIGCLPIGSQETRWLQSWRSSSCCQGSVDNVIDGCMSHMSTFTWFTAETMHSLWRHLSTKKKKEKKKKYRKSCK